MSLYDDLGVTPDADLATLKAAHRRAVKSHHPDNGGDREKFEKAQRAWDILSDPVKRERYDRLGETNDRPNNEAAELTSIIIPLLDQVLATAGADLAQVDVMGTMRGYLDERIHELQRQIHLATQKRRTFQQVNENMSYTGEGPNLIANVMSERVANAEKAIAQMKDKIRQYDRAALYLDLYSWDFTPRAASPNTPVVQEFNDEDMGTVLRMVAGKA